MNNTKWREIFKAFYALECDKCSAKIGVPWMVKNRNGYKSGWDETWAHFGCLPERFEEIEWLKIRLTSENRAFVLRTLARIHVPGEVSGDEVFVYGYRTDITYLKFPE